MVRQFDYYVLDGQTPTSTGTQDFTVSGVGGTPIGCVVVGVRATSANTVTANLSTSWGVSDGTNTYSSSNVSRDNVGTSDTAGTGSTDLIRIIDPDTDGEDVVGEFDSFISNGVRIDFTTVDASNQYRFMVILIFGSDTEVHAFTAVPSSGGNTVTCGFEADFVLTSEARNVTEAFAAQANMMLGIAVNDGSDTVCSGALVSGHNKTTTETRRMNYSDRLAYNIRVNGGGSPDIFGGYTVIDNYTSTSFDVTEGGVGAGLRVIGLAVKLPSGLSYELAVDQSFESSLGTATRSLVGSFLPGSWFFIDTANAVSNQTATFGAVSTGACDFRFEQFSTQFFDRHNVGTTESGIAFNNRSAQLLIGNNGNGLQDGEVVARDEGEYDIDVDDVTGTVRRYHALVIEEYPFEPDMNVDLPAMNADLDAEQLFDATIDVGLPSMAADIEAEAVYDASIGATLPSASVDIDAELQLDATISAGLPSMAVDVVAESVYDATISAGLSSMGASLVAETFFEAVINAGLPSADADLDAELRLDATIGASLPSMAADIDAELDLEATIAAGLPGMAAELEAELQHDAVIDAGFPALAAEIDAEQLLDAVIDAGLPAVAAELEAELQLDATIGAGFATMSATLVADAEAFAAITAGLPAAQAAIEAELDQDVDAVITAALAAMAVDIEASSLTEATIDAGLPAQDADLDAEALYDAAISAGLPAADADLDADVSNDAVIVAGLASVDADLDAELRLDAVINVGLPAISAELRDFLILGCDTELLGTKEQVVNLLGTSDVETALLGTSDVETALEGSSNITTNLAGTSDTMVDLEGEHC